MNLLITGTTGFIGSNFIRNNRKYAITSISLKTTPVEDVDYSFIDTIVHLAGLTPDSKKIKPDDFFRINTELTFNFAKQAKENGVKHFIFISTTKVYGEPGLNIGSEPLSEISECHPIDPYSSSKLLAEQKLATLVDDNYRISIVRIPLVYGAGVKGNLLSLIKLVDKLPILPLGNMNNKRSMLYVANLIDFLKIVIDNKASGVYIVCDKEAISTTKLLQLIAKSLNKNILFIAMPKIVIKPIKMIIPKTLAKLDHSFQLNNSMSCEKLKYSPKFSVEEGVKDMVNYYRNQTGEKRP